MIAARQVVKARDALRAATSSGDASGKLTEALVLLDAWLYMQDERTKRDLARHFGIDNLPVSARPISNQDRAPASEPEAS